MCCFSDVYSHFFHIILHHVPYTSSQQETSLAVVTIGKVSSSADDVYFKLFQHTWKHLT